eukprot:5433748-Amphidinium_carterae.1
MGVWILCEYWAAGHRLTPSMTVAHSNPVVHVKRAARGRTLSIHSKSTTTCHVYPMGKWPRLGIVSPSKAPKKITNICTCIGKKKST